MRLAFVIQDLFHLGAQYVTAVLVRGFVARGYSVDLVVSCVHTDMLKRGEQPFEVPPETNWVYLPDRKARRNVGALRRYLKTTDADAIIAMAPHYMIALSLAAIGLRRRPKLYVVEHSGVAGIEYDGKTLKMPPNRFTLSALWQAFVMRRFSGIMAVSSGTADDLARVLRYPREKISVVYNPVVDDIFREKVCESPQHPWLLQKTCPTFVAAGAHTGCKGHIRLFEAVKAAQRTRKVRLVLFGQGALTVQYRAWIAENGCEDCISLGGFCSNLPAEIRVSDGFVCSSVVESFSVVLVEALACGVPVIATDCHCGPREILRDGAYGRLVPLDDTRALTEALLHPPKVPAGGYDRDAWVRFTVDEILNRYERALGIR